MTWRSLKTIQRRAAACAGPRASSERTSSADSGEDVARDRERARAVVVVFVPPPSDAGSAGGSETGTARTIAAPPR